MSMRLWSLLFAALMLCLPSFGVTQTTDQQSTPPAADEKDDEKGDDSDPSSSFVRGRVERPIPEGTPPPAGVVIPGEWEPAIGVMVAWPFRVPADLLREIAKDDQLYILVQPSETDKLKKKLSELELDTDSYSIQIVPCSTRTCYPRDYGPHQIFDGQGKLAVLDQVFGGWPMFKAESKMWERDEPHATFWRGAGDDEVAHQVAAALKLPVYRMPGYLTGGNFLVDGCGGAFCTEAQIDENFVVHKPEEYRQLVATYGGISRLNVLKNMEPDGIQHIDCSLKVLDSERLLVKRPPQGHPEEALIEHNLKLLAKLKTAYGKPYEILYIDCPQLKSSWIASRFVGTANYTNSLIFNKKIFVPMFGIDADQQAIETWKRIMPGYRVIGFPHRDWRSFDALHCRTRAVFDPQMLRIVHSRLAAELPFQAKGYAVNAMIDDRSEKGLLSDQLLVHYREVGQSDWNQVRLLPTKEKDQYQTHLPAHQAGAQIEYFVSAADRSGRQETWPRTAPQGTLKFTVVGTSVDQ